MNLRNLARYPTGLTPRYAAVYRMGYRHVSSRFAATPISLPAPETAAHRRLRVTAIRPEQARTRARRVRELRLRGQWMRQAGIR